MQNLQIHSLINYISINQSEVHFLSIDTLIIRTSGYFIYPYVLKYKDFASCPHSAIMCFILFSERTAIISRNLVVQFFFTK